MVLVLCSVIVSFRWWILLVIRELFVDVRLVVVVKFLWVVRRVLFV